jgi:excisionase family DNA binding protein
MRYKNLLQQERREVTKIYVSRINDRKGRKMDSMVMTVDEVAELLRLSRNAAYEAVARKEIPSVRIGRRILIPRAGVEALLAGKTAAP